MKTCKRCKIEKELIEFSTAGKYKDLVYYRPECKNCVREYMKSDAGREAQIKYRNSENGRNKKQSYKKTAKYKAKQKIYEKERYHRDELFALKKALRGRLWKAFKSKKWHKDNHFTAYIGCTYEELKQYLEARFAIGMTWQNFGQWEIDHIIPLCTAKTPEELYKLCHYSNLQPLLKDNHKAKSLIDFQNHINTK